MAKNLIHGSGKFKKGSLAELAGDSVLLVGCGKGIYLEFCSLIGRRACGVDISGERVSEANGRCPGRVAVADATALPYRDKSFDTVTLWDVLEHLEDDRLALTEALRVARKNILISVPRLDEYPDHSSGVTFRTYKDLTHKRYYDKRTLDSFLSVCEKNSYSVQKIDRIRPLLVYSRAGIPRTLLSIIDRLLWLVSTKSESFMRNFFVEIKIDEGL